MQIRSIEQQQFKLAKRADTSVSAIRKIFAQIPNIDIKRKKEGQSPLIDLSIGQPHLLPNPEVMQELKEMRLTPMSLGILPPREKPKH